MGEPTRLHAGGLRLVSGGLAGLLDLLPVRRPALAVLTYHRVAPREERPDLHPGLCVTPEDFADQVDLLTRRAHPVSLDEVVGAAEGGVLPARAVHVTFDDAYEGVERHAWPVLRRSGVPATLFVPTAYPDRDHTFWWDRLHHAVATTEATELAVAGRSWSLAGDRARRDAFARLRSLAATLPHHEALALVDEVTTQAAVPTPGPATSSWAGIRRLAAEGMAIGAHSRTHPILTNVDGDRMREEVEGSFADLRRLLGTDPHPAIAYPGGGHDPRVVAAARTAGAVLGFTTRRGVVDPGRDGWLTLPRINVGARATAPLVHLQLHTGPHRMRALAHRVGAAPPRTPGTTSRRTSWN